jgi:hypothetical protein
MSNANTKNNQMNETKDTYLLLTEDPTSLFVKYFLEAIVIASAAYIIPNKKITFTEIAIITAVAILTLFLLDMYSSTVAVGTRFGAGLGIGYNLVTTVPKWRFIF